LAAGHLVARISHHILGFFAPMAPGAKQAKRSAGKDAKKAAAYDDEQDSASDSAGFAGRFFALGKSLVLGSVIAEIAPTLPVMVKNGVLILKGEKELTKPKPKVEETKEETEEEEKEKEEEKEEEKEAPQQILEMDVGAEFSKLRSRLHWSNPLGLAMPVSGEESTQAWLAVKSLEIDFGPRSKKKGTPTLDRITTNLYNNLPQYLHILLALMILRSFLFRSFFACLPWMVGYQYLSLVLPLESLPSLPQVPLEKVPVELRVAATVGLNGLLQLFFLYELVWKTYLLEKPLWIGILLCHAYVARPVEA